MPLLKSYSFNVKDELILQQLEIHLQHLSQESSEALRARLRYRYGSYLRSNRTYCRRF